MKPNRSTTAALFSIALFGWGISSSMGADFFWINTGASGDFTNTVNWDTGTTPNVGDNAIFTNNAVYQVNWSTSWTNANAFYTNASGIATITNNIGGGNIWFLTNSMAIGSQPGSTATVVQNSGFLVITNAVGTGTGSLIVGQTNNQGASFTLQGGADVRANVITIGSESNASGSVLLTGTGTTFTNISIGNTAQSAFIGSKGSGNRLTVTNGAFLFTSVATIGFQTRANSNIVTITSGGTWVAGNGNVNGVVVGQNGNFNELRILDGGTATVFNGAFRVGGASGSDTGSSNTVLVSGPRSVLITTNVANQNGLQLGAVSAGSGGNSLIVSNGGFLFVRGPGARIGSATPNNKLTVTGSGSVWTNESDVLVGVTSGARNNALDVADGGVAVLRSNVILGLNFGAPSNTISVSDPNSSLQISATLVVGQTSSFNRVTISAGGVASVRSNVFVGQLGVMTNNEILVSGGSLFVTNAAANAALVLGSGGSNNRVTLNSGLITVDQLSITNDVSGMNLFSLNGGTLKTKSTTFSNGTAFAVGNGTSLATLNLDGGNHFFGNGLSVSSNGTLKGTGTAQATTTVQAGGTLAPGASPGILTINGDLTLLSNAIFAVELNGTNAGTLYDQVNVIGGVNVSDSILSIALGYSPNPTNGDTFVIVSNDGSDGVNGLFRDLSGNVLSNNAEFIESGGQFAIRYNGGSGNDVILIAVPEPSMLLLGGLGTFLLQRFCRRRSLP